MFQTVFRRLWMPCCLFAVSSHGLLCVTAQRYAASEPRSSQAHPLSSLHGSQRSHEAYLEESLMLLMLMKGPLGHLWTPCVPTWACRYTCRVSYQRTPGNRFTLPHILCDKPQNSFKHFSFKVSMIANVNWYNH